MSSYVARVAGLVHSTHVLAALCAIAAACTSDPGHGAAPDTYADGFGDADVGGDVLAPGLYVEPQSLSLAPGGSAHALVRVEGDAPVTDLAVDLPERLSATLEAHTVAPGEYVLLRLDAGAHAPGTPWYDDNVSVNGTLAGARVDVPLFVSWPEPGASGVGLTGVAIPPVVDVTGGAPATTRLVLSPLGRTTGTLRLRPIPHVRFDPPTISLDGLSPVSVNVTVEPELTYVSELELDGFIGRERAVSVKLRVLTLSPTIETPPVQLAWHVPDDVYLRAGSSVTVNVASFHIDLLATSWSFVDLPPGVTASSDQGILTFTAAEDVAGAHWFGLHGEREGYGATYPVRLLVGRAGGDWPMLGDSPTVKVDAYDAPAGTALAVDAAGAAHVVCASARNPELRVYEDGAWRTETTCGCGHLGAAGGRLCLVLQSYGQVAGQCWYPPFTPPHWPTVQLTWEGLHGAVAEANLTIGYNATGKVEIQRFGPSSWQLVGRYDATPPLLAIAPGPTSGAVLAEKVRVDHLTTAGWVSAHEVQVSHIEGATVTRLEGLDAEVDFPHHGAYSETFAPEPVGLQVTADGLPVVVWVDSRDDHLHVSRWDGAAWQPLVPPLAPSDGFFVNTVRLKLDPAGAPVVAWLESSFPTSDLIPNGGPVHVRVHRVGASAWEDLAPAGVNVDPTGPASAVELALDSAGRPFVAWQEAGLLLVARYAR